MTHMTYASSASPRSFFSKLLCLILLFVLSGLWALASGYPHEPIESPRDYYTEQFVPSLVHAPFARARSEGPSVHTYHGFSEPYDSGERLAMALPQHYLSFIAQEPVYPLHVALLEPHSEEQIKGLELGDHSTARLGTFSQNMKLYRFSSGCNLPVYLGDSNILFSEPLGSTFVGNTFAHAPVIATPEPTTFLIYCTLGALTLCILRRRTF